MNPSIDNRYQRSANTLLHSYSVKRLQLGSRLKALLGFILVIVAVGCDNPGAEEPYMERHQSGGSSEAAHSLVGEWGDRELNAKRRQQIHPSNAYDGRHFHDQLVMFCQTTPHRDFCANEMSGYSDTGDKPSTIGSKTDNRDAGYPSGGTTAPPTATSSMSNISAVKVEFDLTKRSRDRFEVESATQPTLQYRPFVQKMKGDLESMCLGLPIGTRASITIQSTLDSMPSLAMSANCSSPDGMANRDGRTY